MDVTQVRLAIAQLRKDMPRNVAVLDLCDFAEKVLGSKPRMSELERRQKNVARVQAWRKRRKAQVSSSAVQRGHKLGSIVEDDESNPFS